MFSICGFSPRARRLLFNPECAYVCKVVSIVEFYSEFRYARLTKIGCWVNSQFHFKGGVASLKLVIFCI